MAKRVADDALDGSQAYLKRQKITAPAISSQSEIRSGSQLRQALAFDQDISRARHAIQSFKAFLDAFSTPNADNSSRTSILKSYLDSQVPADEEDKDAVFLHDIMQTWSYASQSNNESLLSAVPAVLALLLRTISSMLGFSAHALRLGRTLLQRKQLELQNKGLKSNKSKEFLISPVLRLLREVALVDGGVLSKQVFRARDQVFQNLPRNLNLRYAGDDIEDRKRPSVRTNAVRFVSTLLKLLPLESKKELLNQRDIVSALTRELNEDPPYIVRDILDTIKGSVLEDEALPRDAKTRIINAQLLSRISTLYGYEQLDDEVSEKNGTIVNLSHNFLVAACTSPTIGVLNRQAGFYPRGVDPDETQEVDFDNAYIDLGLDSIEWIDKFTDKVPVRNTILSEFVQNLRPWSDTRQSDLLLLIFKAAPELVAEYFYSKSTFSFDPKLTATWIGYSALIFSTIALPTPEYFGHQDGYARLPPPTAIVLENILPQPLSQKVLRACLLHDQSLITFFVIRLLCVSFSKLQKVLNMYQQASNGQSSVWRQASERLKEEFCERCPSMKDVIFAYRKISNSDLLQREACTKLLILYFEVAPRIAVDAKFDVSEALAQALGALDGSDGCAEDRGLRVMELENLFRFAHFSPGMKWFGKMNGFELSPFVTMLKLAVDTPQDIPLVNLKTVLSLTVKECDILQQITSISALDTLIMSLRSVEDTQTAQAVLQFLDNCVSRCASKPVNYILALEEIRDGGEASEKNLTPISLLNLAIAEQWPYLVKTATKAESISLAGFVAEQFARTIKIKEDKKVVKSLIKQMVKATLEPAAKSILEKTKDLVDGIDTPPEVVRAQAGEPVKSSNAPTEEEKIKVLNSLLHEQNSKSEDHSALVKWTNKEIDEVIEGGHAASLIHLLSSQHLSVRKEAATNVAKLAAKVKASSFEEKDQIWLLLCEVSETAKQTTNDKPLPAIISAFAAYAVPVLVDPLHCLYAKINKFLSQGPTWEVTKIPLMYKILDEAPSLDDARYTEISWLLSCMLAGLRTKADMDIFRTRRVFEKLFSLYSNPYLGPNLKDKILRLLFRATTIEGGSTTMITRFSAVTWLQAQVALSGGTSLKVLMQQILDSSDRKRVSKWSNDGVERVTKEVMAL